MKKNFYVRVYSIGSFFFPIETAEALTIPVDYITAQRLHQCLRTEHVENHVNRRQQISEGTIVITGTKLKQCKPMD